MRYNFDPWTEREARPPPCPSTLRHCLRSRCRVWLLPNLLKEEITMKALSASPPRNVINNSALFMFSVCKLPIAFIDSNRFRSRITI